MAIKTKAQLIADINTVIGSRTPSNKVLVAEHETLLLDFLDTMIGQVPNVPALGSAVGLADGEERTVVGDPTPALDGDYFVRSGNWIQD